MESLGTWISAEDLRLGDELLTATGQTPDVDGLIHYTLTSQTVYNLTVEGLHTFYVLAGDQAVLVHNAKGKPCNRKMWEERLKWLESERRRLRKLLRDLEQNKAGDLSIIEQLREDIASLTEEIREANEWLRRSRQ